MLFRPRTTIVFQGDSITDATRRRGRKGPNDAGALGHGYVFHVAAELLRRHADCDLQVYNRGISGDKVYQLADRWGPDCLDLSPDVISVLIGVNDYWHVLNHGYGGTIRDYERDYDALLERTREKLPNVRLVIGEPFLLLAGDFSDTHLEAFRAYREAARRVAERHDAIWVPFQQAFDEAQQRAPASYWAPDGVHPSVAGHKLMAEAWLSTVNNG
ncbi:MAG: SGNH/GDSL hydrolase family protein [Phycisphaeraceae bacterium]